MTMIAVEQVIEGTTLEVIIAIEAFLTEAGPGAQGGSNPKGNVNIVSMDEADLIVPQIQDNNEVALRITEVGDSQMIIAMLVVALGII